MGLSRITSAAQESLDGAAVELARAAVSAVLKFRSTGRTSVCHGSMLGSLYLLRISSGSRMRLADASSSHGLRHHGHRLLLPELRQFRDSGSDEPGVCRANGGCPRESYDLPEAEERDITGQVRKIYDV